MLEAANDGATKTQIMYRSFMSYAQLKQYLSMLEENSLLVHDQKTSEYKTTAKGLKLLKTYNQMSEIMKARVETSV